MLPPSPNSDTMYFIGVTTAASSIHAIFPKWTAEMGIQNASLVGIDCIPNDRPERYRDIVAFIKREPFALGALVTTHKLTLFDAASDLFDEISPLSQSMAEVSSIYKRGNERRLHADTSDPLVGGIALSKILPPDHWIHTSAEVCILGAGGASVALSWHLLTAKNRPSKITITDRDPGKLEHIRNFHQSLKISGTSVHYQIDNNDQTVSYLPSGSLVINATGMGKDTPGSPLTSAAIFPDSGYVWELNYRGELLFLDQARAQQHSKNLTIADGNTYFELGWKHVIADIFGERLTR